MPGDTRCEKDWDKSHKARHLKRCHPKSRPLEALLKEFDGHEVAKYLKVKETMHKCSWNVLGDVSSR
jgi:hypothetical protein